MIPRLGITVLLLLLVWPAAGQVTQRYGLDNYSKLGFRRNGISKAPPAAGSTADVLKQTSGAGSSGYGPWADGAGDRSFSDNFTASSTYTLTQVKLKFGRFNSSVTGQLRCHIYACSGVVGTGLPTGSTLGQSLATVDISTLDPSGYPNGQTQVTFNFAGVALTSGTVYCHVLVCESFSGTAMSSWSINTIGIGTLGQSTSPVTVWSAAGGGVDRVFAYENWGH